jgi:hypothetical protein
LTPDTLVERISCYVGVYDLSHRAESEQA